MDSKYYYGMLADRKICDELAGLHSLYGLSEKVLNKLVRYYRNNPSSIGRASAVSDYLHGILEDYGYTKEEITKYLETFSELLCCNPAELQRKVIVLNSQDLLDTVLFERPYHLLSGQPLTAIGIYALGRKAESNGEPVDYNAIYKRKYTNTEIQELKKRFPLTVSEYERMQKSLEDRRIKMRQQNTNKYQLENND